MRILITGASGLIGGRLSEYLFKKNIKVKLASRFKKIFKKKEFKKINWNSNKNLEKLCKNIDVVINCAGYDIHKSKIKKKTFIVNSIYPNRLFKAAQNSGVKFFIFLSSAHVYKNKLEGNINERTKAKGNHIYSLSKLDGEKKLTKAKNKNTKLIILRATNLFGYPANKKTKCWQLLINSMVRDLIVHKKTTILSKKNIYRNYGSLEGFCNFVLYILKKEVFKKKFPTIINYCSQYNLNLIDVVNLIKKRFKILKDKEKIKIIYKNINLKKTKKLLYKSIYSKRFKFRNDRYFTKEIDNLIFYCKSNFIQK